MRSDRRLTLHRERLAELRPHELGAVAGATRADSCHVTLWDCPSIHRCPSLDYCPTLPLKDCPIATF